MNLSIISWNIRGLGRLEKVKAVKRLISEHKPGLLFLQESKLKDLTPSISRKLWNGPSIIKIFAPSIGSAGGLISMWNSEVFVVSNQFISHKFIAIIGNMKEHNFECGFLNIYGPTLEAEKGLFLNEISEFLDFIQECCLVDLPLKGGSFTWSNRRDPPTLVRLDRFLVTFDFIAFFQSIEQRLLNKSISDHNAIMLINDIYHWGPRPFKFFNYHFDEAGFVEMVSSNLLGTLAGRKKIGVIQLLKAAKIAIKDWSVKYSSIPEKSIKALEEEIQALESSLYQGQVDSRIHKRISELRGKLWQELRKEERAWLQKSRLKWFREGDRNTKFFHLSASNRRRYNSLNGILFNGARITDPAEIKCRVFEYFFKAYNTITAVVVEELDLPFNRISSIQQIGLESVFSEEEVWRAISSSDSNKAPGPDGFNMGFFKRFWPQLKEVIMKFFSDFHCGKGWEEGINHSFITLIPKKNNPESLDDYRPISLVGSMYKILSKVLACRINKCADTVISRSQFAFIQGRHILDCSFIANECIDEMVRRKAKGVVFKIDFKRAYDTIDWNFLIRIMKEMNFGDKWCDWVSQCISTASISVLVNGVPTERFRIARGLRQGCSMSPMLFNIVGEALHLYLSKAVEIGLFSGFSFGNGEGQINVSHLQFADDLMIFCEASLEQVMNVKRVLRVFELASGLQLNLKKSRIFGINIPETVLDSWADSVGCEIGKFPTEYLGLPLGPKRNSVALWEPIVDKFSYRLASWKSVSLSFGGRIVLLKSVLFSLPIYYMSLFKLPMSVYRKLTSLMANFLWGGSVDKRKIHWVKWADVCLPKTLGGLGLIDLEVQNRALLGKWIWKFANSKDCLWQNIIVSKYHYEPLSLLPNSCYRGKLSWIWGNIVNSFEKDDQFGICMRNNFKIQVGDGRLIRFWFDLWLCDVPLSVKFPRIFAVCSLKEGTIADFGSKVNGVWMWNIPLRRSLFDWECDQWNCFLDSLIGFRSNNYNMDWISWEGSSDGKFSVKSLVNKLSSRVFSDGEWKSLVWRGIVPPKVEIFTWLVIRKRIPVRVDLASRGVSFMNNILCPLCGLYPESVFHLLFNCTVAWQVWSRCAAYWGLSLAFPGDPGAFLLAWHGICPSEALDSIWHFLPFAILWTIWLFRNDMVFNNCQLDVVQLFFLVKTRAASWFKACAPDSICSLDDLILDPSIADRSGRFPRRPRIDLSWKAPPLGFLKMNIDGAMLSNGTKGGIGGIVRNSEFVSSRLILESDSVNAIDWISNPSLCPLIFKDLVASCRIIIEVNSVILRYIPRHLNTLADELAKKGIG
ncbi:hypothetical protein GQ457_09G027380 [Hibiscus cannabinus]